MLREFSTFLNLVGGSDFFQDSHPMGWDEDGRLDCSRSPSCWMVKLLIVFRTGQPGAGAERPNTGHHWCFCMDNSRPVNTKESVYMRLWYLFMRMFGRLNILKSSHGIVCVQSSFLLFLLWVWVNTYGGDAQLFQVQGFDPKPYYIMITIL